MTKKKAELIVALDVSTLAEVRSLMAEMDDLVDYFKVGSQLFTACGPAAVRFIEARGKRVFLDLKFHDIPNTVATAVSSAIGLSVALDRSTDYFRPRPPQEQRGIFMLTLHTVGGEAMMRAAVTAAAEAAERTGVARPLVVGVTVLTSDEKTDNILSLVLQRAESARRAGMDGVVASCHEAPIIRREFGPDFVIVTPGIRPQGAAVQDQQRVATPGGAIAAGSSFLVVGRPIVQSPDPRSAAKQILQEMAAA